MERSIKRKIVVIGAGNVATHLAKALSLTDNVLQVYSRNIENARLVASTISGCEAIDDLAQLRSDADVYLVSVKDDAIKLVMRHMPAESRGRLWLHTSGSVPMEVFSGEAKRYGVLYPLQTFSRDVAVDVSEVPFFVEGVDEAVTDEIKAIACGLSSTVRIADSECRQRIHIAAVFACNFVNRLWAIANDVLQEGGLSFDLLIPLIRVTLDKLNNVPPVEAQTGPARRGDEEIMKKHMSMLSADNAEIYRLLSQSIMNQYKTKN